MSAGFKIWNLVHSEYLHANSHVGAAAMGIGVLAASSIAYAVVSPKFSSKTAQDVDFVPPSNLGIRNIFDLVGGLVQGLAKDIIGQHYEKYLPLLIFIFMWTLLNNLLGVVPGFGSATDNLNTTLAMGMSVFFYYNYQGFKAHGFKYLEHFTGHLHGALLLILGPVMFVIELISHSVRPATLGIRLRSNIYGDHMVFGIFTDLFHKLSDSLALWLGPVGRVLGFICQSLGPVPIVVLGLLVCVIQAFVFTLLTTIYVGIATAHDDH